MRPLETGDPIRLGPYRLLGVLGEGGMGKVYVGQDQAGTVAAVKVLRPELAHDGNLAQRFVREALAARAVSSPGVAAVLGAQTEGGRPWIATEFLAGPTLDQIVDRHGPLDDARLRALAASVARTLRDIHAAGFVHRDLKPPNIVLTARGPRVIDFGIARPEHGLTLTTTGQIPVTPGYGAPEQVLGRRVAPAADVFSLGAVLVYAATGHRAFRGTHVAAVQYDVVHGEPDWQGVTPEWHALIAPCLAKDPAVRPTPEQIATAFAGPKKDSAVWRRGPVADAIRERERAIRELSAPLPTARTGPSRRGLVTSFAAGGALLAAGGGGTAWWLLRAGGGPRTDPFRIPPAVRTPAARVLSADDGDYLVGGHPKPLWSHDGVVGKDSPAPLPIRDVVVTGALSGGVCAVNVVDGKRRWTAPDLEMTSRYLSLSDRLLVGADREGTLHTFVPSTGEAKWTAPAGAKALLAADATAVYVWTKDHRLRAVGRSDARIRWTVSPPAEFRDTIAPEGAVADHGMLVLATTTGHAFALDARTGRTAWTLYHQARKRALLPAARDGVVYLNGKSLSARRITDGRELWQDTDKYADPPEYSRPSVFGDSVYACVGGTTVRLAVRDGDQVWFSLESGEKCPVVVQGGGAWLIDDSSGLTVHTANLDSGDEIWSYDVPLAGDPGLAAAGNRAFVRSGDTLLALPVF
ncbi:protein kinase [Streptomyces sp. NPDC017082]|uniref:serine/threonine-protein kinase n=1 Tax=Streptomyces sp. NPDC017082 TaxID=3364974 RepID=UPI003788E275